MLSDTDELAIIWPLTNKSVLTIVMHRVYIESR